MSDNKMKNLMISHMQMDNFLLLRLDTNIEDYKDRERPDGDAMAFLLQARVSYYRDASDGEEVVVEDRRGVQVTVEFFPAKGRDSYFGEASAVGTFVRGVDGLDFDEWLLSEGVKEVYYALREQIKLQTASGVYGSLVLPSIE